MLLRRETHTGYATVVDSDCMSSVTKRWCCNM